MIETKKPKGQHGGARQGAGRPSTGRKPFVLQVRPEVQERIRALTATRNLNHPGELLEEDYACDTIEKVKQTA